MNLKTRETDESAAFFNGRLDKIRMSVHERLQAKAQLARAEAFADAVVGAVNFVKNLLKVLVVRPYWRRTTSVR